MRRQLALVVVVALVCVALSHAQNIQLADGTIAVKSVSFSAAGDELGAGDASEATLSNISTGIDELAAAINSTQVDVNVKSVNGSAPYFDPCEKEAKTYVPIDIVTATTTQVVAASASDKVYICGLTLFVSASDNVTIVEDNDSGCVSPAAGVFGGVTAAEGWNWVANQGIAIFNGGKSVGQTASVNRYVCIISSTTAQLSGGFYYVLEP